MPEELVDLSKTILHVKIISSDGDLVKLNLPVQIAEAFLKSSNMNVGGDALKNIDFDQLIRLVKSGAVGKLVEITSADGDVVEIYVE